MAQRAHSNLHYVSSIIHQTWRHPSNRGRRVRAVARAVSWQTRKRLHPSPVEIAYFGWRLRCYPDSNSASNVVYFTEMYDPSEMDFMRDYLREGDAYIDVGANIGTYSLLARRLIGSAGRIVGFEAHPRAAERYRENLELNGLTNVEVHEAAVSDHSGVAEFLDAFDVSNRVRAESDRSQATRTVAMVTLDETLGAETFALGKLDIEGHEVAALRGAALMLARADPPVWQIEVLDNQLARAGTSRAELIDILLTADFRLADYDRETGLRPIGDVQACSGNVWAVHREAWEGVVGRVAAAQRRRSSRPLHHGE